jgi:hypothetical protein
MQHVPFGQSPGLAVHVWQVLFWQTGAVASVQAALVQHWRQMLPQH